MCDVSPPVADGGEKSKEDQKKALAYFRLQRTLAKASGAKVDENYDSCEKSMQFKRTPLGQLPGAPELSSRALRGHASHAGLTERGLKLLPQKQAVRLQREEAASAGALGRAPWAPP